MEMNNDNNSVSNREPLKESQSQVSLLPPRQVIPSIRSDAEVNYFSSASRRGTNSSLHAMMVHNPLLLEVLHGTLHSYERYPQTSSLAKDNTLRDKNLRAGDDNMSTILSAFYAKFVVVLGIAFPVTDVLSLKAPQSFYQGFYLYLYLVSVCFVVFVFTAHLRTRVKLGALLQLRRAEIGKEQSCPVVELPTVRYGSFYLRIVAVAFGIGSMVYSGLEFGQYFELKQDVRCQNSLIVLNPAARMLLTILQMQLIFLNSTDLNLRKYRGIARFGLMHMIATNVCEWLYVLVEETKHEMSHIAPNNDSLSEHLFTAPTNHSITKRATSLEIVVECRRTNIMGNLMQNASSILFPCTIEYSLICAVTLFEMWKNIRGVDEQQPRSRKLSTEHKGAHHFSVDCARAHKGMFGGILIVVLSIISLIVYFELSVHDAFKEVGNLCITATEGFLFGLTTFATLAALYQMRNLRYSKSYFVGHSLDCNLLVVAQSGVYIYTMFSIAGSYFSLEMQPKSYFALIAELLSILQTSVQTLFILNAWWRRCRSSQEIRKKPGRELITFLLVSNMAMWSFNALVKSRAAFRPTHLQFFGNWAWTIITHMSMPLAIFYRLHSTICLFEIWKTTYKVKK